MTRTRAERRHHHRRMLHRTSDFTKDWGWNDVEEYGKHIRKLAENRKKCSCIMCGNARRLLKQKTMQELRFEEYGEDE